MPINTPPGSSVSPLTTRGKLYIVPFAFFPISVLNPSTNGPRHPSHSHPGLPFGSPQAWSEVHSCLLGRMWEEIWIMTKQSETSLVSDLEKENVP